MPYVVSDECILCGACVVGCANGAIQEGDSKSVIDPSLCIECGTCAENCPSGAITFVEEKEVEKGKLENSAGCSIPR
jgi:ferredoxin